ncbi:LPS-assembly protein LptD [Asticcacaulis tiandongensis]|uniref:LPS-assembly protein LptD n=1 Tax=Asticcacaulis tiandongensis TaxID=2565365 RepID=UPI0015E85D95|nr:LPS assembly protein LptD [Asticcacaulis tiandongensis]
MTRPCLTLRTTLKFGVAVATLISAASLTVPAWAQDAVDPIVTDQVAFEDAPIVTRATPFQDAADAKARAELANSQKGDDGLKDDGAFISANEVTAEEKNLIVARGQVEMRYDGRLIRADEVRYNQQTGHIVASGNTQTINPDGSIQYADRLEFIDSEQTGSGDRVASISEDNSKLFANKVERIDDNTSQLSEVIFTPCELCVKDDKTQEPTWSIQAAKIVQDKNRRMVYYRHAVFKAKGVPVLYTPILWHADPSMNRASGFLMPKYSNSKRRGLSLELPYLWAVSPYTDIIISPQLNQKINPLLNMEVNRKFYSGELNTRFGFTNEAYFTNRGDRFGEKDNRGYVLADGEFKINPDWRWNFTAQHVFDRTDDSDAYPNRTYANFFERYKVSDGFPRTGEFRASSRQLINQANLIRQSDNAYASLSMMTFQNLRIGTRSLIAGTDEYRMIAPQSNTMPAIAPMVEAHWSPDMRVLGGRTSFMLNGVAIKRYVRPIADIGQGATGSVDSSRLSVGGNWRRDIITPVGLKVAPFIDVRHDEYNISEYDNSGQDYRVSRTLSTAGIDLSYPLIRKFNSFTAIIEPMAQVAISPDSQVEPYLTNEDSQVFEFDASTLFRANKSPGFDLYEDGQRLSLGLKTQLKFNSGYNISTLIGRTYRAEVEPVYLQTYIPSGSTTVYEYDPSGLAGTKSDWIVQAEVSTPIGLRGYSRYRLDSDNGKVRRGETGLSYSRKESRATLRYIVDNTQPGLVGGQFVDDNTRYEKVQLSGQHFFTRNWGVSGRLNRDINNQNWTRSEVALIYRDDCTRLELVYERDETLVGGGQNTRSSSSLSVRISLATLTTSDSDFTDFR